VIELDNAADMAEPPARELDEPSAGSMYKGLDDWEFK
jgi:hypothetical protein